MLAFLDGFLSPSLPLDHTPYGAWPVERYEPLSRCLAPFTTLGYGSTGRRGVYGGLEEELAGAWRKEDLRDLMTELPEI